MAFQEILPADLALAHRLHYGLQRDRIQLAKCDAYYRGEQPLNFLAPALKEELGSTIQELVINWARVVADAYEARLDVEGFRYPTADGGDENLWAIWQANDMDEQSQMAHLDSIALGRSYVTVGSPDASGDAPLVTVESPFQMWTERDHRTRKVRTAIKQWTESDFSSHMIIYTPSSTVQYAQEAGRWVEVFRDDHLLGRVPVVVLANRPRMLQPDGVSELMDVIPLADAANKMATDMMVSGEFHAMPRRWAFGLKASDFKDQNGNTVSTWSKIAGRLWASESKDISVGTFQESDLAVFHNTIKLLAGIVGQLAALPPHYLGFTGDNPASADAIRSSETQLVKRVERKHTFLGGSWEEVQRLVLRFQTGEFDPAATALETVWRDPSTPTEAQKADAITKHVQTGVYNIPEGRRQMGLTDTQIKRMETEDRNAADPFVEGVTRALRDPAALG